MARYKKPDLPLKDLNYEFISGFEFFVRNNSLKESDPCTTNGTMKHLERLKKMATWAQKNEWIDKNPFSNFRLKFKHTEREFLSALELATLENQDFGNFMLDRVKDLFLFSCYTGLSYVDLMELRPSEVLTGIDKIKWIKTTRAKTDTPVNVPLLKPAQLLLEKFSGEDAANRPGIVGTWTNWMIYIKYPEGTIKWLRERSPSDGHGNRPYKYFQFLSLIGKTQLLDFIDSAIDLMKKCSNWDQFKRLLAKGYNKTYQADMFDKDAVDWKPRS